MVRAVAAAAGVGYNISRYDPSLRIQRILLLHRPEGLSNFDTQSLFAAFLHQFCRQDLQAGMA